VPASARASATSSFTSAGLSAFPQPISDAARMPAIIVNFMLLSIDLLLLDCRISVEE
jgi:hypothetical protein